MNKTIFTPIQPDEIKSLHIGDTVLLGGIIITGRDKALKWLHDCMKQPRGINKTDLETFQKITPYLNQGVVFHCGPIVKGYESGNYEIIAAGPTTSIRSEPYMGDVMRYFNLKGIIGKGGMGEKTRKACQEVQCVYLHAIGGTAALIAESVQIVIGVHKMEFGMAEAMWVLDVKDLQLVITMDAHGNSLHETIKNSSAAKLHKLLQ